MTTVALILDNADLARQIEIAARNLAADIRIQSSDDPHASEIVVSDRPLSTAQPPSTAQQPASTAHRPEGSTANPRLPEATVAIGWNGPADVILPADATAREVALSCMLLGDILQLRRARTDDQIQQRQMWQLAHSDPLSGIPNRRAWDAELPRRLRLDNLSRHPLVLALVDLDKFKRTNERVGHAGGDQVIQVAAEAMASSLRTSDFVARFGGDEFAVLLANCGAPAEVLERLRRAIGERCSAAVGLAITASIGYSVARYGDSPESLFERADAALREAKATGRDRVVAHGQQRSPE